MNLVYLDLELRDIFGSKARCCRKESAVLVRTWGFWGQDEQEGQSGIGLPISDFMRLRGLQMNL